MSIYLQNLNSNIDATISRGGITFRKDSRVIDMICEKAPRGFIMHFCLEGADKTVIRANSAAEIQKKLAPVINDLFRMSDKSLKGMI